MRSTKIDKTADIKAGMAALWDATNKQAVIMPAAPTHAQMTAFIGVFNTDRKKLGTGFDEAAIYSDQLALIDDGPVYVKVDGAVEVGDLLEFSETIAGSFTRRTYKDLNAAFDDTEVEAEIRKQAILPRIKVIQKATAAGTVEVKISGL